MNQIDHGSFGEIFVLHAKRLPRRVMADRIVKHLVSMKAMRLDKSTDIVGEIKRILHSDNISASVRNYAQSYINVVGEGGNLDEDAVAKPASVGPVSIDLTSESKNIFAEVDWDVVVDERRRLMTVSATKTGS